MGLVFLLFKKQISPLAFIRFFHIASIMFILAFSYGLANASVQARPLLIVFFFCFS